jgi:biopolymer transport protein TolR
MAGPLLPQGNPRSFRRPPMGDINVTPFVDVMLVLLVVFMITAPMMTQGVQVALPQVENTSISEEKEPVSIAVTRTGKYFIQEVEVDARDLVSRLQAIKEAKPNTSILVRADKDVPYGAVMSLMGSLQSAGLVDVGLLTEPPVR